MNLTVGFSATIQKPSASPLTLRLTGHSLYRIFVNGKFAGHGPARAAHGFYRVDEIDLTAQLRVGDNVIAIEVAGYNANSYYLLNQPSFLQAEVIAGERVLASTAGEGHPFAATVIKERVQKVQRYSFQRPFSEVWQLAPGWDDWRTKPLFDSAALRLTVVEPKALLPRGVAYSRFELKSPVQQLGAGSLEIVPLPAKPWKDRSLTWIGPKLAGYPEAELAAIPSLEIQTVRTLPSTLTSARAYDGQPVALAEKTWALFDLGVNRTGFLGARIDVRSPTRLFFIFDEILTDGDVNFRRDHNVNLVAYELAPGSYDVESFEPYTLRYLKLIVLSGDCSVSKLTLREFTNPDAWRAQFTSSDPRLDRIFTASQETFSQNAVDIFMDCPSRERAGWLCDSLFAARVAQDLTGTTVVEKNFLQNYLLPEKFEHLPAGMLPMCYPADHPDGIFIPNWSLWFVLQLEEYAARSGDRTMVDAFRPRLHALLDYFKPFENEDGLLEKLPSWVFVEWSKANAFVQDVNYPTNMLYASALATMARLYDEPVLATKAEKIRDVIRQQSFDGEFFVDNATRVDGKISVTRNRTEVCQYFAFYFDVVTPTSHPQLWSRLTTDFGPHRQATKAWPEVWPANSFVGNVLRFELLSRYSRQQQVLDEASDYWLFQVELTGTLWENDRTNASCNHGFASHAAHVLLRDVLGLRQVNAPAKKLVIGFSDLKLNSCRGRIPTPDGFIELEWTRQADRIDYRLHAPASWKIEVTNDSGLPLKAL
ncbi:alpha-L-rhamnosidase-related protein [Oleiharenicola lentus]|uniref:alpha-L-rhamnosidase-related protein n=1 Tax=Oleiharenicola lentus TaxID=2508720 RepID=UPI003F67C906